MENCTLYCEVFVGGVGPNASTENMFELYAKLTAH